MEINKCFKRLYRILVGKKGIYGFFGKKNHFSQGVLIYENARIGKFNYFAPYTLINNAIIGNYCSVGPGCAIGLGEHDTGAISTNTIINNGEGKMVIFSEENKTIIGHDVWIGAHVVVKQGVHIGNGSVIGAGSVVTHDVLPYSVVYGVPAEFVRFRFPKEKTQVIDGSGWFFMDQKEALKCVSNLSENFR